MSLIKRDLFFWLTASLLVVIVFFMLSWMAFAFLISGAEFNFYAWYLLPIVPLGAAFVAFALYRRGSTIKKAILNVFIVLNIIILAIIIFHVLFVARHPVVVAGLCLGLIALSAYYNDVFKNVSAEAYIAGAIALLYFNVVVLMRFC